MCTRRLTSGPAVWGLQASTSELRQRPRRRREGDGDTAEGQAEARDREEADERWGSQLELLEEQELSLPALWEWLRSHPLQAAAAVTAAMAMGGAAVMATRRLRSLVGLLRLLAR